MIPLHSMTEMAREALTCIRGFLPCRARPSGVKVSVRPNAYDPNRAHVIINNYSKRPTVSIDLSAVLRLNSFGSAMRKIILAQLLLVPTGSLG